MSELDEGIDAILDDPEFSKSLIHNYVNLQFGKPTNPGFSFSGTFSVFSPEV